MNATLPKAKSTGRLTRDSSVVEEGQTSAGTGASRAIRKQTILCGTDFSVHAREAANVAAALGQRLGDDVKLIHVADFGGLGALHPEVFLSATKKTELLMEKEIARLRKRCPSAVAKVLSGSPHQAIVHAAEAEGIRCVVVASLGYIALSRMLIGSVAERVAETSPVPTLVVRRSDPLIDWASGKRSLKVLVGYDFSHTADAALEWVRGLQTIGGCDIIVAHVNWPPDSAHRLGHRDYVPLVGSPSEVEQALQQALKARTTAVFGDLPLVVHVAPNWGRPDGDLVNLAQLERVDLVVVGTHQRHGLSRLWLGSVSRGVLHHAPTNVAVVPPPPSPVDSHGLQKSSSA